MGELLPTGDGLPIPGLTDRLRLRPGLHPTTPPRQPTAVDNNSGAGERFDLCVHCGGILLSLSRFGISERPHRRRIAERTDNQRQLRNVGTRPLRSLGTRVRTPRGVNRISHTIEGIPAARHEPCDDNQAAQGRETVRGRSYDGRATPGAWPRFADDEAWQMAGSGPPCPGVAPTRTDARRNKLEVTRNARTKSTAVDGRERHA